MTRVFVSYSSQDGYFVDFLVELLRFHHVDVWVDRIDLHAGDAFASDIERALVDCDKLLVVISRHSLPSQWVTREVSTFRAKVDPERVVIPLVLDAEVDVNKVYEGLGQLQQLRFCQSMLDGFNELLLLLGKTLFPDVERRTKDDRRVADRRRSADRRASSVEQRLRVGIEKAYYDGTGRGQLDRLERWSQVGKLALLIVAEDSPLQAFNFADRETGRHVHPGFDVIEAMALASWNSRRGGPLTGAAYFIDDIVNELITTYDVTPKERRADERRSDTPRRSHSTDSDL